eukprot:jgi/Psemu1/17955/gm1.17955_g
MLLLFAFDGGNKPFQQPWFKLFHPERASNKAAPAPRTRSNAAPAQDLWSRTGSSTYGRKNNNNNNNNNNKRLATERNRTEQNSTIGDPSEVNVSERIPDIMMSTTLGKSTMSIDPVRKERLELGKKVFKVPVPSKRKSARRASRCQRQKPSNKIKHHLLLGPTLKRQRKKQLEREKENKQRCRTRTTKNDCKWFLTSGSEKEIKLSDVFHQKSRYRLKERQHAKTNNVVDSTTTTTTKRKIINISDIKHLARCGGVKCVSGLKTHDDNPLTELQKSCIPPPFEPKVDDPYIIPQPGQLISYLWHTRPNPVYGAKQIFRTGILCSTDGNIRFFESDSESDSESESEKKLVVCSKRKFFERKFYLNKRVFNNGDFRVRTDLERDQKTSWISPDDLVGNYEFSSSSDIKNGNSVQSCSIDAHSAGTAAVQQTTIDLTQDDECQSHQISTLTSESSKVLSDPHLISETDSNPATVNPSAAQAIFQMPTSWYRSMGIGNPSSRTHDVRSKSELEGVSESSPPRYIYTENLLTADSSPVSEPGSIPTSLDFPVGGQTLQDTYARMNESVTIQMKLNLVKQHGMALELLMSSRNDIATIMACLQYIKRIHRRGIPVGPMARKLVSSAETTSQLLMEDMFLKNMTEPLFLGGRGYSISHAKMIHCRIWPILGSNLGSLDSPSVNVTQVLRMGLNAIEATDAFSCIQRLEDDILLKSITLKRQLEVNDTSF